MFVVVVGLGIVHFRLSAQVKWLCCCGGSGALFQTRGNGKIVTGADSGDLPEFARRLCTGFPRVGGELRGAPHIASQHTDKLGNLFVDLLLF